MGYSGDFSAGQNVYHVKAGTYTASLLFEGNSKDKDSRARLKVNGKTAAFGKFQGENNWKQVVLPEIVVEEGGEIDISMAGSLSPEEWMDIAGVAPVPEKAFVLKAETLRDTIAKKRTASPVVEIKEEKTGAQLKNGNFSEGMIRNAIGYPDGYPGGYLAATWRLSWRLSGGYPGGYPGGYLPAT